MNCKKSTKRDRKFSGNLHTLYNSQGENMNIPEDVKEAINTLQASTDQSKLLLADVSGSFSLDFIKWYSGMEEQKILNAFERYKRESGNDS